MGKHYSKKFKSSIIKRLLLPGGESLEDLSKVVTVSKRTILQWQKQFESSILQTDKFNKAPTTWTSSEKLSAVFEVEKLSGEELGYWLRSNGLELGHVNLWKKEIMDTGKIDDKDKIISDLKKKLKSVELDLDRKDKALSEVSALLVLKKKADLIWGMDEDR